MARLTEMTIRLIKLPQDETPQTHDLPGTSEGDLIWEHGHLRGSDEVLLGSRGTPVTVPL